MTTHHVRHRSASGELRRSWEFIPEKRRIVVGLDLGAKGVTFAVDVCSPDRPIFGAVPVQRIDSETWRMLPQRVIRTWPGGVERLECMSQPITTTLGPGASIMLSNTPPEVSALLEAL